MDWAAVLFPQIPWIEKILRPIIVYAAIVVVIHLAGKRELAQVNSFDLVVLLLISNVVQNATIGDDNSISGGLLGAATLLIVNHCVVRYLYGHDQLERLVGGDADMLIANGVVQLDRLKTELITPNELLSAAHRQGFGSFDEIDCAILEPGGGISFFAKKPTPETARHLEVVARLDKLAAQLSEMRS